MMLWRVIRRLNRILPPKWGCSDLIPFQPCNGENNAKINPVKKEKDES
jgi:hypothetical protein